MSNDLELLTLTAGDPLVPPGWRAAVAAITHQDVRRVMVIGAADVGKSTLCRVLLGAARRAAGPLLSWTPMLARRQSAHLPVSPLRRRAEAGLCSWERPILSGAGTASWTERARSRMPSRLT